MSTAHTSLVARPDLGAAVLRFRQRAIGMALERWMRSPGGFDIGRQVASRSCRSFGLQSGRRRANHDPRLSINSSNTIHVRHLRVILQTDFFEIGNVSENTVGTGQLRRGPEGRRFRGLGSRQFGRGIGRRANGRHLIYRIVRTDVRT